MPRHNRIWALFIVLMSGVGVCHAQSSPLSRSHEKALTQYVHDVWDVDAGLPQNTVRAVLQTSDGYLWLGTEEGLARFNGIDFRLFDRTNTPEFDRTHVVRTLFETADSVLWVGTLGGGLLAYRDGSFRRYGPADGLQGEQVSSIAQGRDGKLWVGTLDGGLFALENDRFESQVPDERLSGTLVRELLAASDGTIWVGTRGGLFNFGSGVVHHWSAADGLSDDFVMTLLEVEDGKVLVGTQKGLDIVSRGSVPAAVHEAAIGSNGVLALARDEHNSLWVGLDGGGLVRASRHGISRLDDATGLSHNRVLSLTVDAEASIWIGTEGGGLNRLRDGKFTTFSTEEGLKTDAVLSVFADKRNRILFGTEGGGLHILDGDEITVMGRTEGLADDVITSVVTDDQDVVWVGTLYNGLNRISGRRVRHFTTADGLPGDGISALDVGPSGTLWIGTDGGVASYRKGVFESYTADDGLGSDFVTAVHETMEGDVWVGTFDGGLARLRNGNFNSFGTREGLGSDVVLAIHEDASGDLWIGTYGGGLSLMREGDIHTFSTKEGLYNDIVYQILEDDNGNLWMSCNKGIFKVAKNELLEIAAGKRESVLSTSYGTADGLKSKEANGGFQPAGWKDGHGVMWFPTLRGLAMIDPSNINENAVAPPTVLESVRVDGDEHGVGDHPTLSPGTEKVEFEFAALSFIAPERILYRYRLEGYETEWNEVLSRRIATYTNLDPGEYTFRVIARNADGVWNESGARYTFTLNPFFYQTFAFWFICAIGVVLLGFATYRFRVRHLRARQRELERIVDVRTQDLRQAKDKIETQANELQELVRFKTRFFNNVSHEFRTPITLTIGPLENALTGAYGRVEGRLRKQMELMLRNSRRLLRLINQLLDLAKADSGKLELKARKRDIVGFVEGVVLSFTAFAEERGIALQFKSDCEESDVYYDPEKLEKVLFNLLSNALKFTPPGGAIAVEVNERVHAGVSRVDVSVEDTGPGIPEDALGYIFDRYHQVDGTVSQVQEGTGIGLSLAKELVELHRGDIQVESKLGVGTRFSVSLQKGRDHLKDDEIAKSDFADAPQFSMAEMVVADPSELTNEIRLADSEETSQVPVDAATILIVDDNRDVREYVRSCLYPHYHVNEATDGVDALEKLSITRPDVIISDVMMPRMDGYEFCRQVKTDPKLNHIPLILLTAKASNELKVEGLELGADEYMSKPFNAREIHARLRNLIKIHDQEKQLKVLNEDLEARVREQLAIILKERERYEQELIEARDRAEESARLKSSILDNMSHEIRTPLTAILGYSQLLSNEIGEEHTEFIDYIQNSGKRLLDTLSSILDLSQLETENVALRRVPHDLRTPVKEVVALFAPVATQKGIKLLFDLPPDPVMGKVDMSAIDRILNNLVGNAVKFTDEGTVTVSTARHESGTLLRVTDTGLGISDEFLPRLFDAFKQESTGMSRSHEGSGLGLAITKKLTELLGGEVIVESEKGKGSVFTVYLPDELPVVDAKPQGHEAVSHRTQDQPVDRVPQPPPHARSGDREQTRPEHP